MYLQLAPGQFVELFPQGEGSVAPRSRAAGYNHYCLLLDDMAATPHDLRRCGAVAGQSPMQRAS